MGATEAVASAVEKLGEITEMILKPRATRSLAKAEAEAEIITVKAEVEAATLRTQARRRAELDEVRHYVNLTDTLAAAKAEIEFKGAKALLPENSWQGTSDPDWFHKWAGYAKETSDQDIRSLWAKVLAGEIVQSGKFSLRLLNTISLLRKSDAEKFSTFCNYVWEFSFKEMGHVHSEATNAHLDKRGIMDYASIVILDELGLVDSLNGGFPKETSRPLSARYGPHRYEFSLPSGKAHIYNLELTSLGRELFALCDPVVDNEYFRILSRSIEPEIILKMVGNVDQGG